MPITIHKFDSWVYTHLKMQACALKGMFKDVHSSLIESSPKLETIKIPMK